jgi:hypothetical protein
MIVREGSNRGVSALTTHDGHDRAYFEEEWRRITTGPLADLADLPERIERGALARWREQRRRYWLATIPPAQRGADWHDHWADVHARTDERLARTSGERPWLSGSETARRMPVVVDARP